MSNTRKPRRAGKTLIELLVIIATASTILSMTGQLLFRVSRTERAVRESGTISRAELRLIRDFRADVRAAASADAGLEDGAARLRLVGGDDEITYRATDGGIERTSTARRELYRLGDIECRFHIDDRFVILEVEPRRSTPGFQKAAPIQFSITAAMGADSHDPRAAQAPSEEGETDTATIPPVEAPLPERSEP